ncbi:MAG: leucine-rich repeat protein [Eubacterium sp.]|nr:leucine-rich repeat protein [Eubacterium sp.]
MCTRMEIADIKANNVKIGKEVFAECGELKNVVLNTKKIKEIGKNLFYNVFHDVNVFVPKDKVKEYQKMLSRSMYANVKAMK